MQKLADKSNGNKKRKAQQDKTGSKAGATKKKLRSITMREPPMTTHLKEGILALVKGGITNTEIFERMRAQHDSQFKVPMWSNVKKEFDGVVFAGTVTAFHDEDYTHEVLHDMKTGERKTWTCSLWSPSCWILLLSRDPL